MNRISKGLGVVVASASFSLLVFAQLPQQESEVLCNCSSKVTFDRALPISHPYNRCAGQTDESLSWMSWASGQTSTSQFHFLDLLELLTRALDRPSVAER